LLDLEYTDDADTDGVFIRAKDNNADTKFEVGVEGDTNIGSGTLTNASAAGDLSVSGNLEVDGTIFGNGTGITGVTASGVPYSGIIAPTVNSAINFAAFTNVWTSTMDAGSVFKIDNTDADLIGNTVLLELEFTDDGDAEGIFLEAHDNNGDVKFRLGAEGALDLFASDGDTGQLSYTTNDAFSFAGGNVGVGTVAPSGLLDVEGGDSFFGTGTLTNTSAGEDVSITGNLEVDGTLYGNGSGITNVTASGVPYSGVTAPTVNHAINFAAFTNVWTSTMNGNTVFKIDNTTADVTTDTPLLDLEFTDDGDANGIFLRAIDNNSDVKFQIGAEGTVTMVAPNAATGTLSYVDADAFAFIGGNVGIGTTSVNARFETNGTVAFTPSSTTNITAGGGVTVANGIMRIQGSGGAIDITVNPQIVAGTADGQLVVIKGQSDANTVKFDDGTGLQLSSGVSFTVGQGDILVLMYDTADGLWIELRRSDN
jgi:hypothetical protein